MSEGVEQDRCDVRWRGKSVQFRNRLVFFNLGVTVEVLEVTQILVNRRDYS